MDFLEIFPKLRAFIGNLFSLFHAICETAFNRFSSLVFALPSNLTQKARFSSNLRILQAVLRRSRLVSFALTHITRAYVTAHVLAHPLSSERLHLLCENAPNLLPSKDQKARSTITFCQKNDAPCRFRRHGVFSGTAFCRRQEIKLPLRVFYRQLRISIRARRRKRLYLPLFRALPCASSLSPSASVFRKIGADIAL